MIIKYDDLKSSDLIKGAVYKGGNIPNYAGDPFRELFKIDGFKKGIGNSSGFRKTLIEKDGKTISGKYAFVVLIDTGKKSEWPNKYDSITNVFTYYGDNNKAGNNILNTKQKGNEFLYDVFKKAYMGKEERASIAPVFIFKSTGEGRDVEFIGLGVPGVVEKSKDDCLKIVDCNGADNYKAEFTVLNVNNISREWLKDLKDYYRSNLSKNAPSQWINFVENGINSLETSKYIDIKNSISEKGIDENENKFINEFSEEIDIEVLGKIELEEGKVKEKFIKLKERNKKVRDLKISDFKRKNGKVFCEICGIDDLVVLDVHHEKVKVSEMQDNHKTTLNDLNILCANCHRKLHGYNLTVSELKERLIMK